MQDLQSITNAGGGGGGGGGDASRISGGDRRVRPYPNQPLKCPRCDSLNTKFCYYNNYNLSQPRHFCKSCRRYWTKGGVLRNVPVGGGCRKTKRSNKPKPSSDPHTKLGRIIKNMNTSAAAATAPSSTANPSLVLQPATNSNLEPTLMAAMPSYDCSVEMTSQFRLYDHERDQQLAEQQHNKQLEIEEQIQQLQQQEKAMMMMQDELTADQTELSVPGNGELTASEWQLGCGDHGGGLLDLPSATAADHHEYWSQSQWIHHHDDHHLFLPP